MANQLPRKARPGLRSSRCAQTNAHFFSALIALTVVLAAGVTRAQSITEVSLAETLYRQARELSAAGDFAQACPKFAESYRLDPATGTLLNLASCHESQGKFATAWLEFSEARSQARRDRRQSRIKYAEEHLALLEPKLSRLTLSMQAGADDPTLELRLDGVLVGTAALGVATPVDPGTHVIEAKAAGKRPWSARVEIGSVADHQTVTIPVLEAEPAAPPPPPIPSAPPDRSVPSPPPLREVPTERPVPTAVYVAGGATLVLAIAASVTGGVYLDRRSSFDTEAERDAVRTLGLVNLGLWLGAGGGAALTTYYYVTRPERARARATLSVGGWADATGAGLVAHGAL
jgi:hypothetical protein